MESSMAFYETNVTRNIKQIVPINCQPEYDDYLFWLSQADMIALHRSFDDIME